MSAAMGFAPQWQDPAHAEAFWLRDLMHFPVPVTPLNATFLQPAFSRGASAAIGRMSMPITGLTAGVHHGYVYLNPNPFQGDETTTRARFAEMQRLTMELGATVLKDWYQTYEPRVLAIADEAMGFDPAAPAATIARHLAGLFDRTVEVWDIHMRVNIPPMNAVFGFEEMIQQTLGEGAVAESRGLLQGFDNKSLALGHALWELSQWIRAQPGLAQAVLAAAVRGGRVVLPPHPRAAAFTARLSEFLEAYGWRSDVFAEFGHPSWREDPSTALTQLKGFLADKSAQSPYARQAEERERRAALERDFEARLPEPARPAFRALLPLVQQYVPVSEDHNFTIDQKFTVVTREAFLALGRRLVLEGRLAEADDVFYLVHDEIAAIGEGRAPEIAARPCRPAPARARRAEPDAAAALHRNPAAGRPAARPHRRQILRRGYPAFRGPEGDRGTRRIPGQRHWRCQDRPLARRGGPAQARRRAGLPDDDARLDPAVRPGQRRGRQFRWRAVALCHRRPRVRPALRRRHHDRHRRHPRRRPHPCRRHHRSGPHPRLGRVCTGSKHRGARPQARVSAAGAQSPSPVPLDLHPC